MNGFSRLSLERVQGSALPFLRAAAPFLQAVQDGLPPWRAIAPSAVYAARTLLAIAVALYAAFSLQLQTPASSAITVLIVANPVSGALISKSLWRLFGTFAGAAGAVLLMAAFAQTPMLFFIAFSLCIGAACIVATLLRYFKAYGAVLAGYTIIIVCAPAFADPGNVFVSALSRVSAVSVGIVSAAAVFLLTGVRSPSRLSEASLSLVQGAAAALAGHIAPAAEVSWREATHGGLDDSFYARRGSLLNQANALQEIIEYAAADSYAVSRQAASLRLGAARLLGTLSSLHPLTPRLARDAPMRADFRDALQSLGGLSRHGSGVGGQASVAGAMTPLSSTACSSAFDAAAGDRGAGDRATGGRAGDDATNDSATRDRATSDSATSDSATGIATAEAALDLDRLAAAERASDLLTRLQDAASGLIAPGDATAGGRRPVALRLFLDWPTAMRNGARGCIVTMLACLFWYITQWPSGPTLLSYLVPAACLLATNPSASRASIDFSTGTLLAIPASYVCETVMLPRIDGFPLLIAALGICLLPGILLQFSPRHGLRAFGYVVFFSAMVDIRNPVRFEDNALLNGWLAFILGTVSLVMVFRALLPANPARDCRRLAHGIARAAARAARTSQPAAPEVWEYLHMQQAMRLIQRLQPMPVGIRQQTADAALACIEIGRNVLRLRVLLRGPEQGGAALPPPLRDAALAALAAIGAMRRAPAAAARACEAAALALVERTPSQAQAPAEQRRIAALLHEAAVLIAASADFLRHDFGLREVAADAG